MDSHTNKPLTCNPTVYGIISQSPLFKVAFPDAIVVLGIDYATGKDETVTRIASVKDNALVIEDLPKA